MFNEPREVMASSVKKPNEVEEAFQFCGMAKEDLAKSISLLEGRLSPVLKNQTDGETTSEKEPEPMTKLAGGIKEIGRNMRMFNGRIASILERLEL